MALNTKYINVIQYTLLGMFLILGSVFGYLKLTNQTIGYNVSESLPQTVFLVKKGSSFSKGDVIQFLYKADDKNFFNDGTRLIKIVMGVPGDRIRFEGNVFFINDVALGKAKDFAKTGKPLTENVSKTLSDDEYFVFGTHPDSFDSRYIHMGYISKSQVVGRAVGAW